MYNDATQIITLAPGDTATVTLAEPLPNSNTTLGINNITIDLAGDYWVEFMVLLQSTTGNFGLDIGVEINGSFSNPSLLASTVITADFEIITISSIATLAAGDVLNLAVSSATGGSLLFGPSLNASLKVMRISN